MTSHIPDIPDIPSGAKTVLEASFSYYSYALWMNNKKDALENIITRVQHHPSFVTIEQRRTPETFDYAKFYVDDILSELSKLDHT